jgi:hypothetical protein
MVWWNRGVPEYPMVINHTCGYPTCVGCGVPLGHPWVDLFAPYAGPSWDTWTRIIPTYNCLYICFSSLPSVLGTEHIHVDIRAFLYYDLDLAFRQWIDSDLQVG